MSGVLEAMNAMHKGKWNVRLAPVIEHYAPLYDVTGNRLRHFLSQAAEETDGFNSLVEYASGKAYEGRADLGNVQAGDGVRYKGRGIFMITGRSNYKNYSQKIYGDNRLISNPELLEQPDAAVRSAFEYWDSHNLNALVDHFDSTNEKDADTVKAITKVINGGTNGLSVRQSFFGRIADMAISLGGSPAAIILAIAIIGFVFYLNKKS